VLFDSLDDPAIGSIRNDVFRVATVDVGPFRNGELIEGDVESS
jgi:hypothetical protein